MTDLLVRPMPDAAASTAARPETAVRCGTERCGTEPDQDGGWSDEELTALALAADPSAPLPADAVPLELGTARGIALLPSWYMAPVVHRGPRKKRHRIAVAAVVAAFVTIDLFGLCATYGPLVLA